MQYTGKVEVEIRCAYRGGIQCQRLEYQGNRLRVAITGCYTRSRQIVSRMPNAQAQRPTHYLLTELAKRAGPKNPFYIEKYHHKLAINVINASA